MTDPNPRPAPSGSTLKNLLIGLAVTLATVMAADVALGLTFCRDGDFLVPLPPYELLFTERQAQRLQGETSGYGRFDPELGWSIKPNGVSNDGLARSNAAGFRGDREYGREIPEGVIRIVTYGESFTHGGSIPNDATWQHLLESRRADLEVLNFGVSAYGTDQAYLRFLRDGIHYEADVVLIGVMGENILRNLSVWRPAYYHNTASPAIKPRFRLTGDGDLQLLPCPAQSLAELREMVESRSLLTELREIDFWVARAPLAYERSWLFRSSLGRIFYGFYENTGRELEPHYRDTEAEPFRLQIAILREFARQARAAGAEAVYVVFFPYPRALRERIEAESDVPVYWSTLARALDQVGIPTIDVTPDIVAAAHKHGLPALLSDRGGHYNAAGNAVVADRLLRELADRLP